MTRALPLLALLALFVAPALAQTCTEGDCEDGTGTLDFGWATYTGTFQDGAPHGHGTLDYGDYRYMGPFVDGREHGEGLLFYPDGRMEKAEYRNGIARRKSVAIGIEMRGTPTTGCIEGDCENGYGVYVFPSGNRYEGQWRGSARTGSGTGIFANGDRYEGGWRDNVFHGQGTYTWATGYAFTGRYADGQETDGTYHSPFGTAAEIEGGELVEVPSSSSGGSAAAGRTRLLVYTVVPDVVERIQGADIPVTYAVFFYDVDAPADMGQAELFDRLHRKVAFTRGTQLGFQRGRLGLRPRRVFQRFEIAAPGDSPYEIAYRESLTIGREVTGYSRSPQHVRVDW